MKPVNHDVLDAMMPIYTVYAAYTGGLFILDGPLNTDWWFNSFSTRNRTVVLI